MHLTLGNILYLAMVVGGFTVFMITLAYGAWTASRPAVRGPASCEPAEERPPEPALKAA